MQLDWQPIRGSTLVSAIAYDEAAQRIYVRRVSKATTTFDDCDRESWETFLASPSKGEHLTRVLERRRSSVQSASRQRSPLKELNTDQRSALLNAFRPAQEIADPKFFAGRREQISKLADALHTRGSCPLIFGDRGLGKSSLAMQGHLIARGDSELLDDLNLSNRAFDDNSKFSAHYFPCSDDIRNVPTLITALANQLQTSVPGTSTRSAPHDGSSMSPLERLQQAAARLKQTEDEPVLLIIDELDRVSDLRGLASLIKSATTDDLRFMLVGIAQVWTDLLVDHASLERRVFPIGVPRMSAVEQAQIIDLAVQALNRDGMDIAFDPEARKRIVELAAGFPWFVHILGQAALISAADDGDSVVTNDRVVKATRHLITNTYAQHFAELYQQAVRESRQRELTLRTFASWPSTDIPTGPAYSVLRKLGVRNPAVYRGHLSSRSYGSVISTPSYAARGLVRFRNEMFRRYVFMVPSTFPDVEDLVRQAVPN